MILQALNDFYERLEGDPDSDIAPYGFSRQKIAFCITLNADGTLHEITDLRETKGTKLVPISLTVLGNAKPSGSGINPCFLWDNPAYLLGYKADDPKPQRTRESFETFRGRHLEAEDQINDPEFSAVCAFLRQWNPEDADRYPALVELGTGFGAFRLAGADHFVHQRTAVKSWWLDQFESSSGGDAVTAQCLITGETRPIARLHEPKIKGVWGGQSSGAAIVSFNLAAFESYGKSQSMNAPVGERIAFQYCTALNHLLGDNHRRVQIGDATTVFWTERPTEMETVLPWVFEPSRDAEDNELKGRVQRFLELLSQGRDPGELDDPETKFYVLGLSPNAARISVRFFWVSTLGELIENLRQHFADLEIEHFVSEPDFPDVWRLLRETVRDSKDLPPLLAGAVIRAVLTGGPYPNMLLSSLIRRMHADRAIPYNRAAAIKACLNRNILKPKNQELSRSLDVERKEVSYHLGRLFAELEQLQCDAMPGIENTIRHRYLGTAAASPANVFPQLITHSQHHLSKVKPPVDWETSADLFRMMKEDRILRIVCVIRDFPTSQCLQDQGLFAIGYYQQRKAIFTKKSDSTISTLKEQEPHS